MERIPRAAYTAEFREQAVRMHEVDRLTIPETAKRLSVPVATLKNWVYATRVGKLSDLGKNQRPKSELEMELARVKRELAEVRMERDLLKNCPGPFPACAW